tara:strand:+ start:77 stop:244 length:168 start_codon:yes stop_codon:yes gene_type:complete
MSEELVKELQSNPIPEEEMDAMKVGAELEKLNSKYWFIRWEARLVKVGNQDMVNI